MNSKSLFWLAVLFLAAGPALALTWIHSAPPTNAPDADFHLSSIWCSRFADPSLCTERLSIPGQPRVYVPAAVLDERCYTTGTAFNSQCETNSTLDNYRATVPNQLNPEYPSGFYDALGLLVSPSASRATVLMRLGTSLISLGLLTFSTTFVKHQLRGIYAFTLLVLQFPLGLFFITSINPSGIHLAVILSSVPPVIALANDFRAGRKSAVVFLLSLCLIAATVRKDTLPIILFLVLSAFLTRFSKTLTFPRVQARRTAINGAVFVVLITLSVFPILRLQTFGVTAAPLNLEQRIANLWAAPSVALASLGFPTPSSLHFLGDFSIPVPLAVPVSTISAIALGFLTLNNYQRNGASLPNARASSFSFLPLLLSWLLPALVLTAENLRVGEMLQPRYIQPIFAAGVLLLLLDRGNHLRPTIKIPPSGLVLIGCSNAFTLSAVQQAARARALGTNPSTGSIAAWTLLSTLALLLMLACIWRLTNARERRDRLTCGWRIAN